MAEIDPKTLTPPTSRVKCPRCGAEPGVRCTNARGFREKAPHGERFSADFPNWADSKPFAPEAIDARVARTLAELRPHAPRRPPQMVHLKTHKIDFPAPLLDAIKAKAAAEDENVSSLIRRVMAAYVEWQGPVRNIKDYKP